MLKAHGIVVFIATLALVHVTHAGTVADTVASFNAQTDKFKQSGNDAASSAATQFDTGFDEVKKYVVGAAKTFPNFGEVAPQTSGQPGANIDNDKVGASKPPGGLPNAELVSEKIKEFSAQGQDALSKSLPAAKGLNEKASELVAQGEAAASNVKLPAQLPSVPAGTEAKAD